MWKLNTALVKRLAIAAGLGLAVVGLSSCSTTGGCVGISSCLAGYKLPADVPFAEVSVDLLQTQSPGVEHQVFSIADNPEMKTPKVFAVVWRQFYPAHVETRVEAGKRVFLRARTVRPMGAYIDYCYNIASFTPQSGVSYNISQPVHWNGPCRLEIRDRATGQLVPDIEFHDASKGRTMFD
jgi:hypothetical protein